MATSSESSGMNGTRAAKVSPCTAAGTPLTVTPTSGAPRTVPRTSSRPAGTEAPGVGSVRATSKQPASLTMEIARVPSGVPARVMARVFWAASDTGRSISATCWFNALAATTSIPLRTREALLTRVRPPGPFSTRSRKARSGRQAAKRSVRVLGAPVERV